ncbi:MAG: glycosyltransferase family 39 protein [Acidobacteriota bacterium]
MRRLLSAREIAIWIAFFLLISALLVVTGFTSDDPDSALYAALSARLADGPASHWIAPEWWGHWDMEGLFREHPAGVFALPTLLGALGVPGVQAAYIVGIAAGLAALLIIGSLVARDTSREEGRLAIVLLQLMPMASIFRIRANHEYPMLVCLLVALVGFDAVRRSWRWWWIAPVALTAGLLVKGVFVIIPLLAAGFWVITNPLRAPGSIWRAIGVGFVSLALMLGVALVYDRVYLHVAGEAFWGPYWGRQLAPLTIATPGEGGSTLGAHLWFYAIRMAWHPAPWSLALVAALWRWRGTLTERWRALPDAERRGLVFCVAFALTCVLALSPASRFAERYIFSANYALATAGAIVASRAWPGIARLVRRLDARVPALPAVCWLVLMLLRLTLGPLLPRISS